MEGQRVVPDETMLEDYEEGYHHEGNSFDPKPLPPPTINCEAQQQRCENLKTQVLTKMFRKGHCRTVPADNVNSPGQVRPQTGHRGVVNKIRNEWSCGDPAES